VIALDTNILVYMHRSAASEHEPAVEAVRQLAEGAARWALPWCVAHEFIAVVTRLGTDPTPPAVAVEEIQRLLAAPTCTPIAEPHGYFRILADVIRSSGARRELVYDARIAATCLAHGVSELWSADHDFGRFPALKVRNPLVG
jgi:toxin-antitoxin system PIN domain toxin